MPNRMDLHVPSEPDTTEIWADRPRSEGGGRLYYFEQGKGPALVLIHGVGLKAEAWGALIPALSQTFRVISVDMPGHGASPLCDAATLQDFVARFSDFLPGVGGPVGLVGHSMGGLLVNELAARHPDKVLAIAALNTVYQRPAAATKAVQARANALSAGGDQDPAATLTRWFGDAPQGHIRDCAEACRQWLTKGSVSGYAAAYRVFADTPGPSTDVLGRIACPSLYITGALDPNSTPEMTHALAADTIEGTAAVIAGAAHMLPMTHSAEVAQLLMAFFEAQFATHSQKGT